MIHLATLSLSKVIIQFLSWLQGKNNNNNKKGYVTASFQYLDFTITYR